MARNTCRRCRSRNTRRIQWRQAAQYSNEATVLLLSLIAVGEAVSRLFNG
jgi:hypothetical protein